MKTVTMNRASVARGLNPRRYARFPVSNLQPEDADIEFSAKRIDIFLMALVHSGEFAASDEHILVRVLLPWFKSHMREEGFTLQLPFPVHRIRQQPESMEKSKILNLHVVSVFGLGRRWRTD